VKAHSFRLLLLGIVPIFLSILSCSSTQQLFATPTPTPTNTLTPTVTNTATSTTTPTVTPVPPPPVTITSCVFQDDCPEANLVSSYLQTDLEDNVLTQVVFPYDDKVRLNIGWCTKDESALDLSTQHISFIFEIDGVSYLDYATIKPGFWWGDDPSNQIPCLFIGAMLSGFQIGQNHQVRIGYSFDAEVSDGWTSMAPFTDVFILDLNPAFIPTATPTETPTPTSTPRPLPTIPYYTSTPACESSSQLDISNTTGGQVTLYLSGPASYVFYINQGDTSLSVCSGTYSYTAYGCGGASDTGTMTSGESHEFYCQ